MSERAGDQLPDLLALADDILPCDRKEGCVNQTCPRCRPRAEKAELDWWRHFAAKQHPDSELPPVGSPLLGRSYLVLRTALRGDDHG